MMTEYRREALDSIFFRTYTIRKATFMYVCMYEYVNVCSGFIFKKGGMVWD